MDRILAIFTVVTVALALVTPLLLTGSVMADARNISLPENTTNIRMIENLKDHTVTLVNTTTNETISVQNFTVPEGNATTNENLVANKTTSVSNITENQGNATTNENLVANKTTSVSNITENQGNATTNENLTTKFKELQGN